MNILAVDIGGTSIKAAYFIDNKIVKKYQNKTNGKLGRSAILNSLFSLIDKFNIKEKYYIGISSAGDIDPFSGICIYASENLLGWTGLNIKETILSKYNNVIDCKVENDAVCHLLSQISNKNKYKNIFLITVGTGIGAVYYKRGEIFYGEDFDLGKFAHITINKNGLRCDCGKIGCAEKEISATGLNYYIKNNLNLDISIKDLFIANLNDNKYNEFIENYFNKFNYFLDELSNKLEIDEFIIGGGVANSREIFKKFLNTNKKITLAKHGSNAGIYGAKYLIKGNGYGKN